MRSNGEWAALGRRYRRDSPGYSRLAGVLLRVASFRRKMAFAFVAGFAMGVMPLGAMACDAIPRTTLALYDGTREHAPRDTRIHRFAEVVLNHLGHRVVYHDISTSGMPAVEPGSVGMVLSWFDAAPSGISTVWNWVAEEEGFCDGLPKLVAFGETGIGTEATPEVASLIGGAMGIQKDGATHAIGADAFLVEADNGLIGFEADFLIVPDEYAGIRARPEATSFLRIANELVEIDLAVLGPAGGYLHATAAVVEGGRGRAFWIVDPFAFFQHVLGSEQWPIPDPTTLAGKRVFFSTITAEGWLDAMPARSFGEVTQLASEALVEKLIEPFPDLPITVAPVTGDLETSLGGTAAERGRQAVMRALSRPNVEGGTQGYSDIRNWDFFAEYDESREAEILEPGDSEAQNSALMVSAVQTLGGAFANEGASTFSRTPNAPRKYASAPFDLEREVARSIEEIADLAGPERAGAVVVWGGSARPFEAALVASTEAGVENIGGGGGIYYSGYPSLTGLWPFSAPVGEHLQIYDGLSGDAAYTSFWTKPIYGFYGLRETLERTEEPRRLKPFHLSFAARSAIFFDTRRAAEQYLESARTADVIPVHATRYAKMVRGFQSMRVLSEAEGAWRIFDRGDLQTVRFDTAEGRVLDLTRSTGVLGARRKGQSLYVSLDPGDETPLVVLADGSDRTGMVLGTAAPALISSRVDIRAWRRTECSVEVQGAVVMGGSLELLGIPGNSYRVIVGGDQASAQTVTADVDGRMSVFLPAGPEGEGQVSIMGPCEREA